MKYIMFERADGQRLPIIFPEYLVHADVARAIQQCDPLMREATPASAGEVTVIALATSGKSTTLDVAASATDARVITTYDYMHGYAGEMEEMTERLIFSTLATHLNSSCNE